MKRIHRTTQLLKAPGLLMCMALLLASCADDGSVGPQGNPGEKGDAGAPGEKGPDGENAFVELGYFEGTITGKRQDNTDFTETFRFTYSDRRAEGIQRDEGNGFLEFERYEFESYDAPYAELELEVIEEEGVMLLVVDDFEIEFIKELTPTTLFHFYADGDADQMEIDNLVHDETTGAMSFDFTYTDDGGDNSTNHEVTITGSFQSGQKVYKEVLYRKGN